MKLVGRILYADEGKVLDFKEPHYAYNEKHEQVEVHLYTKKIRLGRMDSQDNYIEIDENKGE